MLGLVTSHSLQTEETMNTASLRSAGEVEEYTHACTETRYIRTSLRMAKTLKKIKDTRKLLVTRGH